MTQKREDTGISWVQRQENTTGEENGSRNKEENKRMKRGNSDKVKKVTDEGESTGIS